MSAEPNWVPPSTLRAAARNRCPRCGRGALYKHMLDVAERCEVCGLDLSAHDAGDGPAVFVILVLGFLVVGLALVVEARYSPPMWVHAVLWPPIILGLAIFMLRFVKSLLIVLHFKHHPEG
jgi:uncharacterized protein (DUF983 family)